MIEVLKKMVEALEWCHGGEPIGTAEAIKAGKQAIAELESQEPVCPECKAEVLYECVACSRNNYPPQRTEGRVCCQQYDICLEPCTSRGRHLAQRSESSGKPSAWVGLTEQERNDIEDYCEMMIGKPAFDAIEAKLKEKNT
jgi:hypothetical protein